MPSQNGHDPSKMSSEQDEKGSLSTFFTGDNKKENQCQTYFGMPHDKIFTAYTRIKPLSYIDPLSLQEALKFMQSYLKVHLQRYRSWCKRIKGPIFQHADCIEISLNSLETGVILQFLENV